MKLLVLNSCLVGTLAFLTTLDAQQRLSRSDERSEAPIEVHKGQSEKPEKKNSEYSKVTSEKTSNTQPEKIYLVKGFSISYGKEHENLPAIERLAEIEVPLSLNKGVYTQVSKDNSKPAETAVTTIQIGRIPPISRFSAGALQEILTSIVDYFNNLGYYGVYATFDSNSIDPLSGEDKRKNKLSDLKIVVWVSEIVQIRTIGKGNRLPSKDSIENEKHSKILENSPLSGRTENQAGNLLNKAELENYLHRLSRHPGRQVDAAISSSGKMGEVVLDFLVSENRPYVLYAQVSNTGVESTGDWRERLGFINYQLTDKDDILSLDYITSEFDETNSFLGSYEIPVIYPNYLKVHTYGLWSEYDGDEVGLSSSGFSGETASLGFEFISNPFVLNGFNFDVSAGFRWSDIEVINRTLDEEGNTQVSIPYLEVAMNQRNLLGSIDASLSIEGNINSISANEPLGRGNIDPHWQLLKGYLQSSVFLEPLIFGAAWNDRSTWQSSTLAHELDFTLRFQHTLGDDRLIPQETFIAGGLYSVRGYRESVASGDSGIVMNLEYRYHLPRSLAPENRIDSQQSGSHLFRNFNIRPPYVYGLPDWDLILRSFVDYGYTNVNSGTFGEDNLTLASTGVGIELLLLSNLNIRLDWGVVLNTLERGGVEIDKAESGDSRFHFVTTLSW
jgi:hemolysin activation/secretion protein